MRRGFEDILQLAKTAVKWNLDTDEGYEKFRFFALENGIKEENLAYYLNAYQAAGESVQKNHARRSADRSDQESK